MRRHRLFAKFLTTLALSAASVNGATSCSGQQPGTQLRSQPLSVIDSLSAFRLAEDYEIRCIAAEPLVVDPVDAVVDETGRIWVVEMRDYPMRRDDRLPTGRITILKPDGDGGFMASVFASELDMPTGIALWHGGAVVTMAGQVAYFPDVDRDLKAEAPQVWITGLSTGNEQLRANHPTLHSDGWWYVASGLRGGTLKAGPAFKSAAGHPPVDLGARDFRFHLSRGLIEAVAGPSQFGLSHDSFGDRFLVSNRNPARKVQFEQGDLSGNPLAGLASSVVDVLPAGAESVVKPSLNAWTTSNLHAGQYTAACAVTVTTSPALVKQAPPMQAGNPADQTNAAPTDWKPARAIAESIFVCEPTGSLVSRDTIYRSELAGRTSWQLTSSPKSKQHDWLTSTDAWFRPVNLAHDRDGGLLIVDMHRAVIEHPQWVPEELANRPDEQFGNQAGRLFAVHRKQSNRTLTTQELDTSSEHALVRALASTNPWIRETATRLLLQRHTSGGLSADARRNIPLLLTADAASLPLASQHALINIFVATAIDRHAAIEQLVAAVDSVQPLPTAMIGCTLRLLGPRDLGRPAVGAFLRKHLTSPIRSVRFEAQLAIARSGGFQPDNKELIRKLTSENVLQHAFKNHDEMIVLAGALQQVPHHLTLAILTALEQGAVPPPREVSWLASVIESLLSASPPEAASIEDDVFAAARRLITDENSPWQSIGLQAAISLLERSPNIAATIPPQLSTAIRRCVDATTNATEVRVKAIELLSRLPKVEHKLIRSLSEDADWKVAVAAWKAWARSGDADLPDAIASALVTCDLRVRPTLLQLIGQSPAACDALLARLDSQAIDPRNLGSDSLRQLAEKQVGVRSTRFQSHLASITNSDRSRVVEQYQTCLALKPEPHRGRELFVKHCAACHKIGDVGQNVGPDISDSRTLQPANLLTAILDPNRAVDNNYFRYSILTLSGNVYEGVVAEEDNERIVLVTAGGKRVDVLRSEIEVQKLSGLSLMPDGFENQLTHQQLADLISFIKNWRYLDGSAPVTLK